jgi:hypothetical protein
MKTLSPSDFELYPVNLSCFGKKELIPKKVINKFKAMESKARFIIENNSFKFPISNARFIPQRRFKSVVNILKKYKKNYNNLIEEFIINFDDLRKEIYSEHKKRAILIYSNYKSNLTLTEEEFINKFFSVLDTFYPDKDSLRQKFSITWDVYEISFPKMRTSYNYKEYTEEIKNKIGIFLKDSVITLRYRTIQLCKEILDKMDTGKIIKGPTVRSLKNLINDFLDLNFIGDTIIENEIIELKKEFIDKYNIYQISNNPNIQKELKNKLNQLLNKAKIMTGINTITEEYKKKISWEKN